MIKRFLILVSLFSFAIGSIWLAGLSLAHDEMMATMATSDCAISVSATECSEAPVHALHALAHRINGLVSGSIVPSTQDLLARLLLVAGIVGLAFIIQVNPLPAAPLRRLARFRELLLIRAQQRFRAWRVTIQELYPLLAY